MFGANRPTVTRAIGEVWPLLAERGCTVAPDIRLTTFAEVVDHLGASGQAWIIDGTEVRVRRPAVGRKGREKFISEKSKQNAVKSMVVKDSRERLLFCCPAEPASCADITHARKLGLLKLLADGPSVEIPADAGYQGLGAQTGGHVVTPPHPKFKKNTPEWYEEMHGRQHKEYSSRPIRVERRSGVLPGQGTNRRSGVIAKVLAVGLSVSPTAPGPAEKRGCAAAMRRRLGGAGCAGV
ncbi:transposase family protein [Streptomyces rubiginosohelvolus]|uniref:transposase family protein n=1 Tax=Streptomyces rubiginosohelvolus TaxID=67362 RepID=UPI0035DED7AD